MIAPSLNAAIAVAYDALSAAERAPDRMTTLLHLRRAGMAVQALEASPIPAHWRQQPVALADMPANVVPIRRARHIPIHCI